MYTIFFLFYKKQEFKKHEAESALNLRNMLRLRMEKNQTFSKNNTFNQNNWFSLNEKSYYNMREVKNKKFFGKS